MDAFQREHELDRTAFAASVLAVLNEAFHPERWPDRFGPFSPAEADTIHDSILRLVVQLEELAIDGFGDHNSLLYLERIHEDA